MPQTRLDQSDALELAELMTFLTDWLNADPNTLNASLTRYLDTTGYDLTHLHHDLHRFAFLLGGTDGEPLFS